MIHIFFSFLFFFACRYLRVPLVLQFFASPAMLPALASEELQELLDCVLFEPGEWSSVEPPVATAVPARHTQKRVCLYDDPLPLHVVCGGC